MTDPIQIIVETLAPFLGPHMSDAVVTGSLEKMGITRERVTTADLERLLAAIALGLNVFVGRHKSKTLTQELQHKLNLPPTPAKPSR